MSICLVAPLHASQNRGYGVERYAYEVKQGLERRGVPIRTIESSSFLEKAEFLRLFRALGVAYEGLRLAVNRNKLRVIHFAEPVVAMAALAIPKTVPIVTTVHEVPDDVSHGSTLSLGLSILKKVVSKSDMLIADSTITRNDLISNLGVPAAKIEVVNLGVGAEFKPREQDDLREVKKIGYLGAISKKKNVKELIDAFYLLKKKHPDLKVGLDLWGKIGKHGLELTRYTELLGLKNVCFRGFADEYSLPSVYNSLDVFVFPSLKEGFGLPILEAKRCGVPTIMFGRAHIADEVKAHTVLASNVSDMADRIYNLLTDSEYADSIRRKALEHSSQFTWDRTIDGVLQVYYNLGYSCPERGS